MLPDQAELAARVVHVRGLIFSAWTVLGLALAVVAWGASRSLSSPGGRERCLVALSLTVVLRFTSLPITALWIAYAVGFYAIVERGTPRWLCAPAVALLLAVMVVLPVRAVGLLGEQGRYAREFVAFATNMAALRFYAYAWDRWRGRATRLPLGRFLLATFFFPTFVNGPVEVPRQLAGDWPVSSGGDALAGLGRVARGAAKLLVVGLALPPGWTAGLAHMTDAPTVRLWLWGALLYVWFYLSFSAWSDVGIGLGRVCGRRVQENFLAPWSALDPADFWRRWHVSLGLWLRDYVYIPLGGNRRHRAANVVVVFAVSAAWHVWGATKLLGLGFFPPAAWGGFFLWGALHTLGVLAAPRGTPLAPRGRALRRAGTFLFAAFCWVPFFLPPAVPFATGVRLLVRMLWPFA